MICRCNIVRTRAQLTFKIFAIPIPKQTSSLTSHAPSPDPKKLPSSEHQVPVNQLSSNSSLGTSIHNPEPSSLTIKSFQTNTIWTEQSPLNHTIHISATSRKNQMSSMGRSVKICSMRQQAMYQNNSSTQHSSNPNVTLFSISPTESIPRLARSEYVCQEDNASASQLLRSCSRTPRSFSSMNQHQHWILLVKRQSQKHLIISSNDVRS